MSYTNVINMLHLGGIPILSKERGLDDPFVIAGGPCVYNPEPLADIIDFCNWRGRRSYTRNIKYI